MNPISVICNVYNEEEYIADAFDALMPYTDEFVVIDQGSTDATVKIAREYTEKVYRFPRVHYGYAYIHQAALMAENEWVLKCDPDERWDEELLKQFAALISMKPDIIRFHMEYGGDSLSLAARLWQKSKVLWTDSFDAVAYNEESLVILDIEHGKITNLRTKESAPDRYRVEGARRMLARYGDTTVEPYANYCNYYKRIIEEGVS